MSKKKKGKKARQRYRWHETKPEEINSVAMNVFGSRYYCIGDDLEQERKGLRQENGLVQHTDHQE